MKMFREEILCVLICALVCVSFCGCSKDVIQDVTNGNEITGGGSGQDEDDGSGRDENEGENEGNEDNGVDDNEEIVGPTDDLMNLSAPGTANCYLISRTGKYCLDATVRGNGAETEGLAAPETLAGTSARIVWQSEKGMIGDVTLDGGFLSFSVNCCGNALLSVCDPDGAILWSWHIWFPETVPADLKSGTGYEVMSMNLGAMNNNVADAGSYGLLYQWGRKDPFPASATLTGDTSTVGATLYDGDNAAVGIGFSDWYSTRNNTIDYAVANPTVCLSNNAQYSSNRDWLASGQGSDALWGNPTGWIRDEDNGYPSVGSKSFYDPCPVGYRVPPADVFRSFTSSGGFAWSYDDFDVEDLDGDGQITSADFSYGWMFSLGGDVFSWFPAASRYDGSYAMLMGSMSGIWGNYWGNCPNPSSMGEGFAFCVLSFQPTTVSPAAAASRADAYSVRCIRE